MANNRPKKDSLIILISADYIYLSIEELIIFIKLSIKGNALREIAKNHVLLLIQINDPYIVWNMSQSFMKIMSVVYEPKYVHNCGVTIVGVPLWGPGSIN